MIERVHERAPEATAPVEAPKVEAAPSGGLLDVQRKAGNQAAVAMVQRKGGGLPDSLKSGVENLSGYSLDSPKVHYNSTRPAELNAHAYAQGQDIYVAPGQEKHLAHEGWHVVQQKQGRVKPTTGESESLESRADEATVVVADGSESAESESSE